MIRKFTDEEVLETFIEVVHKKFPMSLVDQTTSVQLKSGLHSIIQETIEKVIKKASPNLSVSVQASSIQDYSYNGNSTFEPFFNPDPADVHFYVSREATPTLLWFGDESILTRTNIDIDYYYPSVWALTPPRDKEMAVIRTMDEILFAWTIVSKTLMSVPIIRFDDEDEAADAVFAFANTLLFTKVVKDSYYYKDDFIRRLIYIQNAIKGNQPASSMELATILYPPNKKIDQLAIPVATIRNNRLTQYVEEYLSCSHGLGQYEEYNKVLKAFTFYDFEEEGFTEKAINDYCAYHIGKAPDDFRLYNMNKIRNIITNDDYRKTRPPMISTTFKGLQFNDICPFTYRSGSSTSIYFEKDFLSHLEKTFKHLNVGFAVGLARSMDLPEENEINDGYDVDLDLVNPFLPRLYFKEGSDTILQEIKNRKYKNQGLYQAEQQAKERATVEYEPNDIDSHRPTENIIMTEGIPNIEETLRSIIWTNLEERNLFY